MSPMSRLCTVLKLLLMSQNPWKERKSHQYRDQLQGEGVKAKRSRKVTLCILCSQHQRPTLFAQNMTTHCPSPMTWLCHRPHLHCEALLRRMLGPRDLSSSSSRRLFLRRHNKPEPQLRSSSARAQSPFGAAPIGWTPGRRAQCRGAIRLLLMHRQMPPRTSRTEDARVEEAAGASSFGSSRALDHWYDDGAFPQAKAMVRRASSRPTSYRAA